MNTLLNVFSKIYDSISSTGIYIGIIIILCISNYIFYNKTVKLQANITELELTKSTLKTALEEQNKKVQALEKNIKEYNKVTETKVEEIKKETVVKQEEVKKELEKDSSSDNQLKIIDNLLLDFSNGK